MRKLVLLIPIFQIPSKQYFLLSTSVRREKCENKVVCTKTLAACRWIGVPIICFGIKLLFIFTTVHRGGSGHRPKIFLSAFLPYVPIYPGCPVPPLLTVEGSTDRSWSTNQTSGMGPSTRLMAPGVTKQFNNNRYFLHPLLHVSKFSSILGEPFVLLGSGYGFESLIFYCRSLCTSLVAYPWLYMSVRPSVGWSVGRLVTQLKSNWENCKLNSCKFL